MQVTFSEFHYTGNHVNGKNSGNYEEVESWARGAGLNLGGDNLDIFWDRLERIPGTHTLTLGGKTIRYTVKVLKYDSAREFGYTTHRVYHLIEAAK